MGVFSSTWSVGWALTPFLGLQVRSAYGDATMWMCVAVLGVTPGSPASSPRAVTTAAPL